VLAVAFLVGFVLTNAFGLLALVLCAAAALVGLVGWCVALEIMDHTPRLRAAHDHDKETPPKGWPVVARVAQGCDCAGCGFHIPDADTVVLTRDGIYHVQCAPGAGK